MDNKIIDILIKLKIIDKRQRFITTSRNDILIIINNKKYKAIPVGDLYNSYFITKNNKYLVHNNGIVELVDYQTSKLFNTKSKFYLLYDDLLCSIIPIDEISQLVCSFNKKIYSKKYIICLDIKINTIFQLEFKKPEEKINIKNKTETNNTDLVKVKKNTVLLDNLFRFSNYDWLDIVSICNPKLIPVQMQKRLKKPINTKLFNSESIWYLYYIINNYNNLPDKICFYNNLPFEIDHFILESKNWIIKHNTLIDCHIKLNETKIKYLNKINNKWGEWKHFNNSKHKSITQVNFWTHILKLIPNKYIEVITCNTYIVDKAQIKNYTLDFYKQIYNYYKTVNNQNIVFLDRCWYFLFKSGID